MADNDLDRTGEFKLGEYLLLSKGAINNVVEKQMNSSFVGDKKSLRIGELLVKESIITQEELDNSLRKQRIDRLAACPIFSESSPMELATLSKYFTEVSYLPNETFIIQGEKDASLFVIAYGLAEVFHVDNNGEEIFIAKVGTGDSIGEMGYFSGEARTAYVRTLKTTQLLQIQYNKLTEYFEHIPQSALTFSSIINQRKKEMDELIAEKHRKKHNN